MRVLVLCEKPALEVNSISSAALVLNDLGCRVTLARFDLTDLPIEKSKNQDMVVIDAQDIGGVDKRAHRALSRHLFLQETPSLLVMSLERSSAIDFSLGFSDFILSPINPAEMVARLRQIDWRTSAFESEEIIKIGDLVVDLSGHEVHISGRPIDFTHKEFELLRYLMENRGRVYSRDQLLQHIWGFQYEGTARTVDIHIRRVRAKLDPYTAGLIITIRNVGYKMKC